MSSFVQIFVFSYCFGLIAFRFKEKYKSLLLDFLKGFLCVVLAGAYVSTGLSFLVSTVGVVLGHKWPVTSRFAERDGEAVLLGTLFAMSPVTAAAGRPAAFVFACPEGDSEKAQHVNCSSKFCTGAGTVGA